MPINNRGQYRRRPILHQDAYTAASELAKKLQFIGVMNPDHSIEIGDGDEESYTYRLRMVDKTRQHVPSFLDEVVVENNTRSVYNTCYNILHTVQMMRVAEKQ